MEHIARYAWTTATTRMMTNAHSIISRNVLMRRLLSGERAHVRSRRRSYYTRRRISYILLQRSRALPYKRFACVIFRPSVRRPFTAQYRRGRTGMYMRYTYIRVFYIYNVCIRMWGFGVAGLACRSTITDGRSN